MSLDWQTEQALRRYQERLQCVEQARWVQEVRHLSTQAVADEAMHTPAASVTALFWWWLGRRLVVVGRKLQRYSGYSSKINTRQHMHVPKNIPMAAMSSGESATCNGC
jgi:hypothetical protein